jgi:hypothetical protein
MLRLRYAFNESLPVGKEGITSALSKISSGILLLVVSCAHTLCAESKSIAIAIKKLFFI